MTQPKSAWIVVAAFTTSLAMAAGAQAQNVSIVPPGGRVAEAVRVPAGSDMIYIAGQLAEPVKGDTKTQTIGALTKIQKLLKDQGFAMSDVVMMRVILVGDPAKKGAMDFAGMNAGYATFFGGPGNKPARITSQSVALTEPGALVEIEVQAAKPRGKP